LQLSVVRGADISLKNKNEYYHLLQTVRDDNQWEAWILFMLKGLEETALETIVLVDGIKRTYGRV